MERSNSTIRKFKNIGIAAFYLDSKYPNDELEIIKPELIHNKEGFEHYSDDLKLKRNNLIKLTIWQMIVSIFGMMYVIRRRNYIYVFINTVSIILGGCGLYGSLTLSAIPLLIHSIMTISLTGGFLFFQIIDFLLVDDTSYGEKRLNDNILLIIFSLPYVFDCFAGVYNFLFIRNVNEHNKTQREFRLKNTNIVERFDPEEDMPEKEEVLKHIKEQTLCIICCDNSRNAVMNPCGHMLCCLECGEKIVGNRIISKAKCPICRSHIDSVIKYREC